MLNRNIGARDLSIASCARRALLAVVFAGFSAGSASADVIASWTFETSAPSKTAAVAGPYAAEVGSGSALGTHKAAGTVYSSPAGNGSSKSFSSNTWAAGDFYQFSVATTGLQNITLSWDQTRSNTGPGDFDLQYQVNGGAFTSFGAYSVPANLDPPGFWNSANYINGYLQTRNLSGISALNNASSVVFRLLSSVSTATGGTNRVDNFTVNGTPVPEPSSYILAGLGMASLALVSLRRRFS